MKAAFLPVHWADLQGHVWTAPRRQGFGWGFANASGAVMSSAWLVRVTNVPLALMLVRMALRPISKTRSLGPPALFLGLPSRSVGSHRFAVALDADRLAAKTRSC